jgi:hypothetical protein
VGARAAGRGGELVPAERASPQGQQQLSSHLISLIIFLLLLLSREIFPVSPRGSKSLARLRNLASRLVFIIIIISELGTIGIPHGFYFILFYLVLNCLHKR